MHAAGQSPSSHPLAAESNSIDSAQNARSIYNEHRLTVRDNSWKRLSGSRERSNGQKIQLGDCELFRVLRFACGSWTREFIMLDVLQITVDGCLRLPVSREVIAIKGTYNSKTLMPTSVRFTPVFSSRDVPVNCQSLPLIRQLRSLRDVNARH